MLYLNSRCPYLLSVFAAIFIFSSEFLFCQQTPKKHYVISTDTSNFSDMAPLLNEQDLWETLSEADHYTLLDAKTSLKIASYARQKSIKFGNKLAEAKSLQEMSYSYFFLSNYAMALKNATAALSIHESSDEKFEMITDLNLIGQIYHHLENYELSLQFYRKAQETSNKITNINYISALNSNLSTLYLSLDKLDSARIFATLALNEGTVLNDSFHVATAEVTLAEIEIIMGHPDIAYSYLKSSLTYLNNYNVAGKSDAYYYLGEYFRIQKNYDSATVNYKKSLEISDKVHYLYGASICLKALGAIYAFGKSNDSATLYYGRYIYIQDSIFSLKEKNKQEVETFNELTRQEKTSQIEKEAKVERDEKMEHNIILFGILFTLAVFVFWSRSTFPSIESIRRFGLALLLVIYEYVNLRLHALISHYNHSEFFLLGCLVVTGYFLVQLHSRFEHYFENVILGILQRIRISKAKEKVVKLENEKISNEVPTISNVESKVNSHSSKPPIINPPKKILKNTGHNTRPKRGKQ